MTNKTQVMNSTGRAHRFLSLAIGFALCAAGSLSANIARAQDPAPQAAPTTLILTPVGKEIKPRYLKRIARSLTKSAKTQDAVKTTDRDGGKITGGDPVACATDKACLGAAGAAMNAARTVGVLVEPAGKDFKITFVMVDSGTQSELFRKTEDLARSDMRKAPGPLLTAFLASAKTLPDAAQPPPDGAQPPPDGTQPPPDGTQPPPDGAQPPPDGTQPPPDGAQPPPDGTQPPPDGTQPPPDGTQPPPDGTQPTPDGTQPTPDVTQPVDGAQPPVDTPPPDAPDPVEPSVQVPLDPDTSDTGKKIHVGVQFGVVLPQLQSELGTAPGFELEGGYRVWQRLSAYASVAYTQPTVSTQGMDPRLDEAYMTDTTQRELIVTIGAFWRILPMNSKFNAYAGGGARVWMLETVTDGSAGSAEFLENRETSTRVGVALQAGGEYVLGPGAATVELDFGDSSLPHLITGDVRTTALSASVGYRMMF